MGWKKDSQNNGLCRQHMAKCDFCTVSDPNGKCFYESTFARESHCKDAIRRMSLALAGKTK